MSPLDPQEMAEVLQEFQVESREIVEKLDRDLLALERTPTDPGLLGGIFRCVHTIKGNSGFLGFPVLGSLTHAGEQLLSVLRGGKVLLSSPMSGALFEMVDAMRSILDSIASTGRDEGIEVAPIRDRLQALSQADEAPGEPPGDRPAPAEPAAPRLAASPESTIRVDVGLLDRLMNLVGELVLSRNGILRHASVSQDPASTGIVQRLSAVTSDLQEGIMKARMQPIGNVWARFPRLLRDLALGNGKKIRLEQEGEGTELDRTILEAVADPLVHLLRNSVDHGIEEPGAREAAKKPPEGRIRLRAFHEGGQVVLEVSDDGGGVDTSSLRRKAAEAGLISAERASRMSESEALQLVFLPGLSTAEKVTHLSGRGVGMDVVKANIEKIGGTVDLESVPGAGTTTRMRIPLTLAIIPALIVRLGGERYAIPQVSLQELVRLEREDQAKKIESIQGAEVLRMRGRLLPLVRLSRLFGLREPDPGEALSIVVVRGRERDFGLVLEEILDTQEIVVKPISKALKELDVFAGATILGDGRVALILDVLGLARRAGLGAETLARSSSDAPAAPVPSEPRQTLLLVRGTDDGRMALPIDRVARLEELPRSSFERAGSYEVVQYRNRIMPLVDLSVALPERRRQARAQVPEDSSGRVPVVVIARGYQTVGLVVHGIVDIVEEKLSSLRPPSRPGVLHCAVIRDRVTELLDVEQLLKDLDPALFLAPVPSGEGRA